MGVARALSFFVTIHLLLKAIFHCMLVVVESFLLNILIDPLQKLVGE